MLISYFGVADCGVACQSESLWILWISG